MDRKIVMAAVVVAAISLSGKFVLAQAATQAIRGAAADVQNAVNANQKPMTAGPEDKQEKTNPGKIDENAPKEFKTTESGLKYRILRKTKGRKPDASNTVQVNYKGWFDDLKIFDSSYRRGEPIEFGLDGVIKGWTEGVQLMGEGEMIELDIPYPLAYGERGTPGGPIPPKAQLHFLIELIEIK